MHIHRVWLIFLSMLSSVPGLSLSVSERWAVAIQASRFSCFAICFTLKRNYFSHFTNIELSLTDSAYSTWQVNSFHLYWILNLLPFRSRKRAPVQVCRTMRAGGGRLPSQSTPLCPWADLPLACESWMPPGNVQKPRWDGKQVGLLESLGGPTAGESGESLLRGRWPADATLPLIQVRAAGFHCSCLSGGPSAGRVECLV